MSKFGQAFKDVWHNGWKQVAAQHGDYVDVYPQTSGVQIDALGLALRATAAGVKAALKKPGF